MEMSMKRQKTYKETKKKILELKNVVPEMTILLEGFKGRFKQAEERISEL